MFSALSCISSTIKPLCKLHSWQQVDDPSVNELASEVDRSATRRADPSNRFVASLLQR